MDRWIELDGAVNVRDLGGLTTVDGRTVRRDRLIRSDNLQGLTGDDVRRLLDEHGVRAVADLRAGVEVDAEGPGPLTAVPGVRVEHLSLFPEAGAATDAAAVEELAEAPAASADGAPVLLPWQTEQRREEAANRGATAIYLGYLDDRADSILAALRLIAASPGATVVHCAAGKDRTGVVIALTLAEIGVPREQIIDDYALSGQRIEAIFGRLRASPTYADDLEDTPADRHRPREETMELMLDALDARYGGASAWLRAHGWTDDDAAALRRKLLDEMPGRPQRAIGSVRRG